MLISLVDLVFKFFYYLILARIIASWVRPPAHHEGMRKLMEFIYRFTEPILGPIRELLPSFGGIDFSPIIAFLALQIIRDGLIRLLIYLF
ncbi:YggT family protein [Orenia marismortui]|uniref:YggT family protein n=1 Tax=Orenia marismortui TaxID=46469 RepID=UPI0003822507|nr:YggT family protein [Orenia marismortui]